MYKMPCPAKQICFYVLSKDDPGSVAALQAKSSIIAERCIWYVGQGNRKAYLDAGVPAKRLRVGNWTNSGNGGLDVACNKPWACMMSADMRGINCLPSDPSAWRTMRGSECNVLTVVNKLIDVLKQTGASIGGIYPNLNVEEAMRSPALSFLNFLTGDFLVMRSTLVCRFQREMFPKGDFGMTCSALATYGCVIRMNHFCLNCPHHEPGKGADAGAGRDARDLAAIEHLRQAWSDKGAGSVFRENHRRGKTEIVLHGGRCLAKFCRPDIVEKVNAFEKASPRHVFGEDVQDFLANVRAQVNGCPRTPSRAASNNSIHERRRKRQTRGQKLLGKKRKAGRRRSAVEAPSGTRRNHLCAARKALKRALAKRPAKPVVSLAKKLKT
eukprot:TRINITY_DN102851_c0_g1_i1.p1 TRINITY_DN102851_c0_g1~~TRINITY_DN102851_c0_g1_i1.p1  ORF type:complete len:383 (-),score=58.26 TRINITY_DN102851_c0_g1_i1:211-1359(-)